MKTSNISSLAVSDAMRQSILRAQMDLIKAQKEVSTGRFADPGLTLGAGTSHSVELRLQFNRFSSIKDTNALVAMRLDSTQGALSTISDLAQTFLSGIVGARNAPGGQGIARSQAQDALKSFISALDTSSGGEFLFSGVKVDTKPVADYFTSPPSAGKTAVDAAFLAEFGMSQTDAGVSTITAADMSAFLDSNFKSLFDQAQWSTTWSSASDQTVISRIDLKQSVDSSVSANAEAFRKMAMALTMVADLGNGKLNQGAFEVVVDKAAQLIGEAMEGIGVAQSRIGVAQKSVADASERISLQLNMINGSINDRESIDPYEAATRVNTIMTQLEASYSLTGRISRLSILNFL